jgi:MFS family permease
MTQSSLPPPEPRWYRGVTRAQWLILALASAGWVFDVYEGQIFNITRTQMLEEILGDQADAAALRYYGDLFLAVFLAGGTLGGIGFGVLADRWGRRPTLILTIAMYSVFSGLTYFAETLWQVGVLRFLVAIGVGGEWSVAAALIAETFPPRARAQAGGIFHATSILGTWLAGLAGLAVGAQWRYAYLLGALPALLIVWVRVQVAEPEAWAQTQQAAKTNRQALGSLRVLLTDPRWRRRAVLGLLLAATGLGTFWGVTVAGQNLAEEMLREQGVDRNEASERAKFAYGIVQATGGGLGLLAFGPLAVRWGRRRTFLGMQAAALIIVLATCYLPRSYAQLLLMLPWFGFFTLGLHAGFAIYFPELFPTSLRATGAGFCFNGGRLIAAPILLFSGWLKALLANDLRLSMVLLSLLFVPGMLVVWALPETKGQPLPEDA